MSTDMEHTGVLIFSKTRCDSYGKTDLDSLSFVVAFFGFLQIS